MKTLIVTGTWICKENLISFLELLCFIANVKLSEEEINDIKLGLTGTNDEENRWSEFSIGKLRIRIAEDPADSVYHVKIQHSKYRAGQVELIFHIAQDYVITNIPDSEG